MTFLSDALSSAPAQRLGWMLLHSVWQFAVIAVFLSALTGQKIQSKPEPWLDWWRKQSVSSP